MRRIAGAMASLLAILALSGQPALATGLIDQQQTDVGGWNGGSPIWDSNYVELQTFTPAHSRKLIAVEVYAGYYTTTIPGSAPTGQVMMEILPVNSGTPDFIFVWAREFKQLPADPAWVTFNISTPVNLVAGTQYAILLQAQAPWGLDWLGSCVSTFAGGQALAMNRFDSFTLKPVDGWGSAAYYCTKDLAFKTIIEGPTLVTLPPTPITLPTATPSPTPRPAATATHTAAPTAAPTATHTAAPTATPTAAPTGPGPLPPVPPPPPTASGLIGAVDTAPASATSTPAELVAGVTSVPSAANPPEPASGGAAPSNSLVIVLAAAAAAAALLGGGFAIWRFRLRS